MGSEYEIFECLPDGSIIWREHASGMTKARQGLRKFVNSSHGEYFAMDLASRKVLFPSEGPARDKRVLQIAYAGAISKQRADSLRSLGYGVLSVIGNLAARNFLTKTQLRTQDIAVFMVGHAAPGDARNEIVEWLKTSYPMIRILALNPDDQRVVNADFNALQSNPAGWLSLVTEIACANSMPM